jgi:hypothetical protein
MSHGSLCQACKPCLKQAQNSQQANLQEQLQHHQQEPKTLSEIATCKAKASLDTNKQQGHHVDASPEKG